MERLLNIHIGKTGGSTVHGFLKENLPGYSPKNRTHGSPARHSKNKEYITWIRNPLDRYVSAFNMHYGILTNNESIGIPKLYDKNGIFKKESWSPTYIDLLNYFKTPNNFAEALSKDSPDYNHAFALSTYTKQPVGLSHINTGLGWYLLDKNFLHKAHKNFLFVGTQESMEEDLEQLKKILNIENPKPIENLRINKGAYDKNLSPLAIKNLKEYFKKDYECLDLLVKYNLINPKKIESYY